MPEIPVPMNAPYVAAILHSDKPKASHVIYGVVAYGLLSVYGSDILFSLDKETPHFSAGRMS